MKSFCSFCLLVLVSFGCQMNAQSSNGTSKPTPPPLYRISQNGLYGYIDSTGKVQVQPVFANAGDFSEGLAAVREKGLFGFIDVHGQYIFKPEFEYAESFEQGKALVWTNGKYIELSRDGSRKAFEPKKERRPQPNEDYGAYERLEKEAESIGFEEITPTYKNRRFARNSQQQWFLTDAKGAKVCTVPFLQVLMVDSGPLDWEEVWKDGLAFVKTKDGFGAIDRDGNFKVPIRDPGFRVSHFARYGDFLVLSKGAANEHENYSYLYGFWNWRDNTLISPRYYEIDQLAFLHGGLIGVLEDTQQGYINSKGEYVWREKKTREKSPPGLNIDYMLRGDFYAASQSSEQFDGHGGWGGSSNYAKKIGVNSSFETGKIQLKVDSAIQKNKKNYHGFALMLANTTQDTLVLEAQDSRIYMYLQAKDSSDTWRDIMYLPSSWCGNSYHKVFLAPGEYWDFTVPAMEGDIHTKLRVALKTQSSGAPEFTSNEFEGGINPAQFWRKEGYSPASIMEPYDD